MALDSSSTFADVEAEYKDTANYIVTRSAAMARLHAVAIKFLLLLLPSTSVKGSNTVSYSADALRDEKRDAIKFADEVDGGILRQNRIVRADFRNLRSYG